MLILQIIRTNFSRDYKCGPAMSLFKYFKVSHGRQMVVLVVVVIYRFLLVRWVNRCLLLQSKRQIRKLMCDKVPVENVMDNTWLLHQSRKPDWVAKYAAENGTINAIYVVLPKIYQTWKKVQRGVGKLFSYSREHRNEMLRGTWPTLNFLRLVHSYGIPVGRLSSAS